MEIREAQHPLDRIAPAPSSRPAGNGSPGASAHRPAGRRNCRRRRDSRAPARSGWRRGWRGGRTDAPCAAPVSSATAAASKAEAAPPTTATRLPRSAAKSIAIGGVGVEMRAAGRRSATAGYTARHCRRRRWPARSCARSRWRRRRRSRYAGGNDPRPARCARAACRSAPECRENGDTRRDNRPRPGAGCARSRHRPPRRGAPRTTPGSRMPGCRAPGPGKVFGVRNTFIRAAFSQMPARASSGAWSITDTLPMPARRSAKASAQPDCPPPTIDDVVVDPRPPAPSSAGRARSAAASRARRHRDRPASASSHCVFRASLRA